MCNRFASHFGLFLHASGASQRLISCLSQLGLSTSPRTIDRTVDSLSEESAAKIKSAGQSKKYMMVYDNLVVDFGSPGQSAVDKSDQSLFHFTTGTYINHHYNVEDLRCAEEVRLSDAYNDQEGENKERQFDHTDLIAKHKAAKDEHGLTALLRPRGIPGGHT